MMVIISHDKNNRAINVIIVHLSVFHHLKHRHRSFPTVNLKEAAACTIQTSYCAVHMKLLPCETKNSWQLCNK